MGFLDQLRERSGSLGIRVAALLSIALLPIGLIAVVQTAQVESVAREREELTYLTLTQRAAARGGRAIERAIGIAAAMARAVPAFRDDPDLCTRTFRPLTEAPFDYVFAGFVDMEGQVECSSAGRRADLSEARGFLEFKSDMRRTVIANPNGGVSGQSVVVVLEPVTDPGGQVLGFVSVSMPHSDLMVPDVPDDLPHPLDLVTFNMAGDVLTGPDERDVSLPADVALPALVGGGARVFEALDGDGRQRVYALVPVLPDIVYALGSWDRASLNYGLGLPVWLFPILMWAISLAVALFAVHWLVIRHLRRIIRAMRNFADRRTMPPLADSMPSEIEAIEVGLLRLAERVVGDEAAAEHRLHEQRVMMKEIHHRVKNNLQLICSLINMQMRQIHSREGRFVLGRVRDRVMSLATIHRNLYESHEVAGIAADEVVREIVDQITASSGQRDRVAVKMDLHAIRLYPDQAVPLSLFIAEVVTNALKYHGGGHHEAPAEVRVLMHRDGGDVCLWIENDTDPTASPLRGGDGAGLGRNLITAFAHQLGGTVRVVQEDGLYRVALLFPLTAFEEPETSASRGHNEGLRATI